MNYDHRYDDIINLPHPVSKNHRPMSRENRAAQFSPFAALTGYDAAIDEAARYTERQAELDEQAKAALDEKLRILQEHLPSQPQVDIIYFSPDLLKEGGHYSFHSGELSRIDSYECSLLFSDGFRVSLSDIYSIDSPIFNYL